ncbi:hypothetical protein FRC11_003700, partial [Ceratobasidium sp. 423]
MHASENESLVLQRAIHSPNNWYQPTVGWEWQQLHVARQAGMQLGLPAKRACLLSPTQEGERRSEAE